MPVFIRTIVFALDLTIYITCLPDVSSFVSVSWRERGVRGRGMERETLLLERKRTRKIVRVWPSQTATVVKGGSKLTLHNKHSG